MEARMTSITRAAELLEVTDTLLAAESDLTIATNLAREHAKNGYGYMGSADYSLTFGRSYIYLDKGSDRERKYTWLNFVKAVRTISGERGALQTAKSTSPALLSNIEARIHVHMQAAYTNILEVGRCLVEAKESGLVAHGHWEAWVQKHAKMSARTAQNLMRAAREAVPGSRLAELPISQIQEILALPAPDREAMAERAQEEGMTVKQLREEIARERKRSDQMILKYNRAHEESRSKDEEIGELKRQLQEARDAPAGIGSEAQAEIGRLEAALRDAEALAEHQSELRKQAQDALLESQSQGVRGGLASSQEDSTAEAVATAARTFISCVGYVPHSGRAALLGEKERQMLISHVEMLAGWVDAMRAALDRRSVVVVEEA